MFDFIFVNTFDVYFINMKISSSDLNLFVVFNLHTDDLIIISKNLRVYYRKQMMSHVFERTTKQTTTTKQMMSLWQYVNSAYELLKIRLRAKQLK